LFLSLLPFPTHGEAVIGKGRATIGATAQSLEEVTEYQIPETSVVEIGGSLRIQVGNSVYELESAGESLEQLPELERSQFFRNRTIFLESVAKGLQMIKYGLGMGAVVKDKAVYIARKMRSKPHLLPDGQRQLSIRERADEVILGMLRGLDAKLFESAPIVARANEFGVVLSGGVEALGGRREKGWGGLIDLGVSIGFNRDSRALVIQVFRDVEAYQSSLMPALALGGLVGKAGFYAVNQKLGQLTDQGTSFYPPIIPGFQMRSENFVMFGFSSGLTWPPSPIGDILTYTNNLDHARLFRLTISPFTRGFVRFSSSLPESGPKDLRMVLEAVPRLIRFIASNSLTAAQTLRQATLGSLRRFRSRPMACETIFTVPGTI
jgi:hypothetical protein